MTQKNTSPFCRLHMNFSHILLAFVVLQLGALMCVAAQDEVSPAWPGVFKLPHKAVAVDEQGNRYYVSTADGYYYFDELKPERDLDPASGKMDLFRRGRDENIYVTRINADGGYAWTQVMGTAPYYSNDSQVILVDKGIVYVAGDVDSQFFTLGKNASRMQLNADERSFVVALDAQTGAAVPSFGRGGVQFIRQYRSIIDIFLSDGVIYALRGNSYQNGSLARINAKTGSIIPVSPTVDDLALSDFQPVKIKIVQEKMYLAGRAKADGSVLGLSEAPEVRNGDICVAVMNLQGELLNDFHQNGVRVLRSSWYVEVKDMELAHGKIYLTGLFDGVDFRFGDSVGVIGNGGTEAFVAAMNATTGNADLQFNGTGIATIGGSNNDYGSALCVNNTTVYVAGNFASKNLGINGAGLVGAQDQNDGFIAALDAINGTKQASFGNQGVVHLSSMGASIINDLTIVPYGVLAVGDIIECISATILPGETRWDNVQGWGGFSFIMHAATGDVAPTINFPAIADKNFGDAPFDLNITPISGGGPLMLSIADPTIANLSGTTVSINKVGSTLITCTQVPGLGQAPVTVTRKLVVLGDQKASTFPTVLRSAGLYLATDAHGNRFVAGNFTTTQDFNPQEKVIDMKYNRGGKDVFVTKINADDSYAWTVALGGSLDDTACGIAVVDDTVFVAGQFASNNFGFNDVGTFSTLGSMDGFIAAINGQTGSVQTSFHNGFVRIGGDSTEYARGLTATTTTLYFLGETWSPNVGINKLGLFDTEGPSLDAFVAAIQTSTGEAEVAFSEDGIQGLCGSGNDYASTIIADNEDVIVSGLSYSWNLGIGATNKGYRGFNNGYIAVLNQTTGAARIAFSNDGVQALSGVDIFTDMVCSSNAIYIVGSTRNEVRINQPAGGSSIPDNDGFVAALSRTNGAALTTFGIEGVKEIPTVSGTNVTTCAIALDRLYIAGQTNGNSLYSPTDSSWGSSSSFYIGAFSLDKGERIVDFGSNGFVAVDFHLDYNYDSDLYGFSSLPLSALSNAACKLQIFSGELSLLCHTRRDQLSLRHADLTWKTADGWGTTLLTLPANTGRYASDMIFSPIPAQAINAAPFSLNITPNNSGKPVVLTIDDPSIASLNDTTVTVLRAGITTIHATQAAGNGLPETRVSRSLTVVADEYGDNIPPLYFTDPMITCLDATGNRYAAGIFTKTRDFNPHRNQYDVKEFRAGEGRSGDIYVTKMSADGAYLWTKTFGGTSSENVTNLQCVGTQVYLTGHFSSPELFYDNSAIKISKKGSGYSDDAFLVRLSQQTGQLDTTFAINGFIHVAGTNNEMIVDCDFTHGVTVLGSTNSHDFSISGADPIARIGQQDAFIARYSSDTGALMTTFGNQGVVRFVSSGFVNPTTIHAYQSTIYIGGDYGGNNFGINAQGDNSTALYNDGFVVAMAADSGQPVTTFGRQGIEYFIGRGYDTVNAIMSEADYLYVAGLYTGAANDQQANFGIGALGSEDTNEYDNTTFIAKLSRNSAAAINAFDGNGIVSFYGEQTTYVKDITRYNNKLLVVGQMSGTKFSFSKPPPNQSTYSPMSIYMLALEPNSGMAAPSLSEDGVLQLSGQANIALTGFDLFQNKWHIGCRLLRPDLWIDKKPIQFSYQPYSYYYYYYDSWLNGAVIAIDPAQISVPPMLTLAPIPPGAVDGPAIPLTITSGSSPFPWSITSSDPLVATINGTQVVPHKAGVATITVTQPRENGLPATTASQQFLVVADSSVGPWQPFHQGSIELVRVDRTGNRYVVGKTAGQADLNPFPNQIDPMVTDYYTYFITRFNADGSYAWSKMLSKGDLDMTVSDLLISEDSLYVMVNSCGSSLSISGATVTDWPGSRHSPVSGIVKMNKNNGIADNNFGTAGVLSLKSLLNVDLRTMTTLNNVLYIGGGTSGHLSLGEEELPIPEKTTWFILAVNSATGAVHTPFGTQGIITVQGDETTDISKALVSNGRLLISGSTSSPTITVKDKTVTSDYTGHKIYTMAYDLTTNALDTSFSGNGWLTVVSSGNQSLIDCVLVQDKMYMLGKFDNNNLGFKKLGTINSAGLYDCFIAAVSTKSGQPVTSFGTAGIVRIGGFGEEQATAITNSDSLVYILGSHNDSITIDGQGALAGNANTSFIAALDPITGKAHSSFRGDGLASILNLDGPPTGLTAFQGGVILSSGIDTLSWLYPGNSHNVISVDAEFYQSTGFAAGYILDVSNQAKNTTKITVENSVVLMDGWQHYPTVTTSPPNLPLSLTFNGSSIAPTTVGTYQVIATSTDPVFTGSGTGTLTIAKAKLFITPDNKTRPARAPDPLFTYTYHGFVGGDTVASVVTTPPTLTTSATNTSSTGRYPIMASEAAATGYVVEYMPGFLTIFDVDVTGLVLRGTASGNPMPTIRVNEQRVPINGDKWQASGELGGNGPFIFNVQIEGGTPPSENKETIHIEATDIPLGGG
jgi:MBG domain/MBG domain (YGX type)